MTTRAAAVFLPGGSSEAVLLSSARASGEAAAIAEARAAAETVPTTRPFLSASEMQRMREERVRVLSWRTFDADVAKNQSLVPTGQTPGEWYTTEPIPATSGYWTTAEEVAKALKK